MWKPYLLSAIFFLHFGCQTEKAPSRPNIVLIMADDLGMEVLNCYGGTSYQTPHLDRLAAEGLLFEHCYSTPLCTPSRVQIMTGKYNYRNYTGFGMLKPGEKTFGHLLKEAGYKTCIAGKWQLYGNPHQRKLFAPEVGTHPKDAGFDEYCLWQIDNGPWEARYKDPRIATTDTEPQYYPGAYGPDKYLEHIESFIDQNQDNNFFVYYPMCLVHDPFQPTPRDDGYWAPDFNLKINDTTHFASMVVYMDSLVGKLVKTLDRLKLRENTLVIFTGDNGTDRKVVSKWRGREVAGRKGYPVKAGTHVPLIASWKGQVPAGVKSDRLIDFTDFVPTLLEAANYRPPTGFTTDGVSFFSHLKEEEGPERDWVFCHYAPRWGKFEPARFVQNRSWKLYDDGKLYNIETDPDEEKPVSREGLGAETLELLTQFWEVLEQHRK